MADRREMTPGLMGLMVIVVLTVRMSIAKTSKRDVRSRILELMRVQVGVGHGRRRFY